jgi:hypothetical protein
MNPFLYEVEIPSTKEAVYFKELTNKQYKVLVKTLMNGNYTLFEMFLDSLIEDLAFSPININALTCIDKAVILLTVRAYNISPVVTLQAPLKDSDGGKVGIDLDVNQILSTIDNYDIKHTFTAKDPRGVTFTGTIPKVLHYKDIFEVLSSCISSVTLNDKFVDMEHLTTEEKIPIVSKLPSLAFGDIFTFLEEQNKVIESIPVVDISSRQEIEVDTKEIYLSLLNGSILELIKMLYEVNLKDFYQSEHSLMYRFKYDFDAINNSTPAEVSLYYKLIAEDVKREKAEMDKQQQEGKMPMPKAPTGSGG